MPDSDTLRRTDVLSREALAELNAEYDARLAAARDAGEELEAKDGVVHNRVSEEGLPVGERSQFPTGVAALDKLIEDWTETFEDEGKL